MSSCSGVKYEPITLRLIQSALTAEGFVFICRPYCAGIVGIVDERIWLEHEGMNEFLFVFVKFALFKRPLSANDEVIVGVDVDEVAMLVAVGYKMFEYKG